MTKTELLKWLTDVPDNASLIAVMSDDVKGDSTVPLNCALSAEPFYNKERNAIVVIVGC